LEQNPPFLVLSGAPQTILAVLAVSGFDRVLAARGFAGEERREPVDFPLRALVVFLGIVNWSWAGVNEKIALSAIILAPERNRR
jgi:hypothetical protein